MLPDQQYKFRVDYDGTQYWSDVVTIIPHEENNIELNLDLLALDLTNDPNPVRYDGVPPEAEPEKVMVASLMDLPGLLVQSIVGQTPDETVYYYVNDHLGTLQKMIDESGAVVWSADHEPFGQADITVDTVENNFRFPGQYYDGETGLRYNYFRYYDTRIGRYLKPDPIGLNGGMNLFAYAQHDPVGKADQFGLYVGGIGFGGTGALELLYKLGVTGSASLLYVNDDKGNWGIVLCGSAGGAVTSGLSYFAGLQTSHLWGVDSVCDLEGGEFSLSVGGGWASGGLGIAGDISSSGLNVIIGAGKGEFGGATNLVASGCKLLHTSKSCDKTECESRTYYGIDPVTGRTTYRRVVSESSVKYYYRIQ